MFGDDGGGWIKVHRGLAGHHLWTRDPFTMGQAWVDLLLLANWHDSTASRGNRIIAIARGQVLTSLDRLAARWKRNRKTVSAWLSVFERDQMLDRASVHGPDGGYSLLTIRNFERYQGALPAVLDDGLDHALDQGADQETGPRSGLRTGRRSGPRSGLFQEVEERKEGEEGSVPPSDWSHVPAGSVKLS